MRVLFINTVYGRGSTGRIVKELGEAVVQSGGEYKVAYGRGEVYEPERSYIIGSKLGTMIHAGLSRITDRAGFYSAGATRKLLSFIREYRPDVIHLHNLHGYYLNVEILFRYLAEEYRGKVIWTFHDCWPFTGHCVHYTYAGCEKWKSGCERCPQKRTYPASRIMDRSENNYREKKRLFTSVPGLRIVTVSEWLKRQAEASFLGGLPVERIYNGIDCGKFRPGKTDKAKYGLEEKRVILSVSDSWDLKKGFDKLLALSKAVGPDTVIVVIGLNRKQIAGLPANMIGLEKTWNQAELIDYYRMADVFFNPSNEETFGLVTAEAMACGTPAVVYDVTASPEVVGTDACGMILPSGFDLADLPRIDKEKYSENCVSRIREKFGIRSMQEAYLRLYWEGGRENEEQSEKA